MRRRNKRKPAGTRSEGGAGFLWQLGSHRLGSQKGFHFLTVSTCLNPPHPAHWPLPILPGSRKIFLGCTHTRFQVTPPLRLAPCVCSCRTSAHDHCVNLVPISPQEQRLRHRRLQAKICNARRRAGPAEEVHAEQRDGVQRLQAVPVRAGAAGVGAHVHRAELLEDVFKSLAPTHGLRKCAYFSVTLKSDAGSKQRNHRLQGVLHHMTSHRLWVQVCRCSAYAYVRVS